MDAASGSGKERRVFVSWNEGNTATKSNFGETIRKTIQALTPTKDNEKTANPPTTPRRVNSETQTPPEDDVMEATDDTAGHQGPGLYPAIDLKEGLVELENLGLEQEEGDRLPPYEFEATRGAISAKQQRSTSMGPKRGR
jgi:hypothetical protein